jgi:endonuclease/exonuclease/phosphatase (EEP) superfamily protein YafD
MLTRIRSYSWAIKHQLRADQPIDWMFEKGFTPLSFTTITTHPGSLCPSDHFPIFAVLQWGKPKGR